MDRLRSDEQERAEVSSVGASARVSLYVRKNHLGVVYSLGLSGTPFPSISLGGFPVHDTKVLRKPGSLNVVASLA